MALNFDKAFGIHADALRVRSERTQLLASNLANASTPSYQARDIDFAAAMAQAGDNSGLLLAWGGGSEALYRVPNHPSRDGNTVEVGWSRPCSRRTPLTSR